ncbi:TIGR04024 family LLM class F420-dependent oxidoreductase [Halocatena salina]|uniref:TIGR04024 family LLM class F420-dependent oxidoreductase n=1 Tax=Halocatena salina TaxID=2934340 RepID=A0A8U0A2A4_9EURY|nr:TIGR04024 family LLM class F420-dependent oxidoreductase [Halocatena salina]UPM43321.1 TIGR04024 family LLM class F420-dependent oxidoreductase [Halocatena salina]
MTRIDVSLPVASQPSVDVLSDQATRAESLGYDRVWMPETWGRDVVTLLTTLAERTDTVGIGASIMPVYSRSPALIGQTAATLQEVSDGRFRLGLGPSGPIVIENWHGASFDRPLRRTRETIEIVKRVLSDETVTYDGEQFELSGFRLRCESPDPRPSIDAAGMGPKAVELAGRFADGWHAIMLTPQGVESRLDDLRRGAELADRDPAELRTTLSLTCCATEDEHRARALVKQHLAFYIGGMGTFYRDTIAQQGYDTAANEIYERWNADDREGAMDAIPEALVEQLAVAGTPEQARDQLERFTAIDGVDALSVSFPRAAEPNDIDTTLAALAP